MFALENQALTPVGQAALGAVPEGVAWSPDSQCLYVGNHNDRNLQVFHVDGGMLAGGQTMALPGQPASLRGLHGRSATAHTLSRS